jgi:TonB family protein
LVTLCLAAFFLLGFIQTATQQSTPSTDPTAQSIPATPADPKERLELGQKLNGLQGVNFPWHVKATYEVVDAAGKSKDKGTFEEWRASEKQYKLAYHSAEFSQEEYGSEHGIFHVGDAGWPSDPVNMLERAIVEPLPSQIGDGWEEGNLERKFGGLELVCTAITRKHGKQVDEASPSFCFASKEAILRYVNTPNKTNQLLFDNFVLFRGHVVARDIRLLFLGNLSLSVHIDTIESMKESDLPTMPASASPVTRRVQVLEGESGSNAVKKVMPEYPFAARSTGVQGIVVISAVVSKDGHIQEAHVMAGPSQLQESAVKAVRQWVYRPYLVDGEAVEVDTQINVVYNLGR